ncbi:MAG: hypothetical protein HXM18_01470 [Gemella morbillorum]|uniref:hypothetical protein n=1 Tax=Gemella morbillorum TaxID=29391 RepID=UPI001CAD874C|nr:hypothetical protein [Gemella morbillorum]MBF1209184.1 hypothetical protein [Gemella morbillorum]
MYSNLFLILSPVKLPEANLKAISKGSYNIEELEENFEYVKKEYRGYIKSFKKTIIIYVVSIAIMLGLTVYSNPKLDIGVFLFLVLIFLIVFLLMFPIIYVQKVNKIRKTFLVAVEKGYPELYNTYQRELYEYVD